MARTKPKIKQKLYVVRKYILADNVMDALKKERKHAPDDCWVDEAYKAKMENIKDHQSAIGFAHYPNY